MASIGAPEGASWDQLAAFQPVGIPFGDQFCWLLKADGVSQHSMNLSLEIRVITRFFVKEKQNRFINFACSEKNRHKFLQELSHLRDLKWNLFEEIGSFSSKGIPGSNDNAFCYVISQDASVDQKVISVKEIDSLTDSAHAFILVFGEAEQIYCEGEPPFNRYLSRSS